MSKQTLFPRYTNGQQIYDEMLNFTSYEGNANPATTKSTSHLLEWSPSVRPELTSTGEDVGKKEPRTLLLGT